jgi:cellulose synthase/poly-beta-1,6-N-acetylglucosamine synthase-like glycosyltransferase
MTTAAALAFWGSLAFLAYAYGGFAVVVAAVGAWRRARVRMADITPPVSLIIAAYNEEHVIAGRLDNALSLDYPRDRLQIIVACDGCSDRTEAIVKTYSSRGVILLSLPRMGKIAALTTAVEHAVGEILVFSDANTICDRPALRALVRNFSDPIVGGVAGHTTYALEPCTESSGHGERLYWDYDAWLKRLESQTGSIVSAHGGLYAIRRTLFRPVPDLAVTDDFAISTAVVEQGYRLVFEPEARAVECAVSEAQREFRRRVRLMTRGLRGVWMRRRLLNPFSYGFYALVLFSHKVARRLAPVALGVIAVTSAYLSFTNRFYLVAAVGQAMFYALAGLGYLLRGTELGHARTIYIPFYYCMANAASAVALMQLLRGKRIELWQPQRHAPPERQGTSAAALRHGG